jgi:hypothetical protein
VCFPNKSKNQDIAVHGRRNNCGEFVSDKIESLKYQEWWNLKSGRIYMKRGYN